jgi:hypothetical protein
MNQFMGNNITVDEINAKLRNGQIREAAKLIAAGVSQKIDFCGGHVTYANVLLATAPWAEITALLPAGTNSLTSSGWVNSLLSGRPVDAQGNAIPWFTYPAIEFLEAVVRKDWRVFEWGSGNSTIWWSKNCASVTAVENNASWATEVRPKLSKNAQVLLHEEKEEYVNAIIGDAVYDVVVVDGEHRNECAYACVPFLSASGIIVYDNSDRIEYDHSIAHLESLGFHRMDFWGLIPSYVYRNCTSIFYRDPASLRHSTLPSQHISTLGRSCEQSIEVLTGRRKP